LTQAAGQSELPELAHIFSSFFSSDLFVPVTQLSFTTLHALIPYTGHLKPYNYSAYHSTRRKQASPLPLTFNLTIPPDLNTTGDMASADAEKTENKIEGTIEAAQELQEDPQSHVNPDTIEKKVVEEAREAGSAAYQFDPDASPEDKANAAKGVRRTVARAIAYTNVNPLPVFSDCRLISTTHISRRALRWSQIR
jgi:hypothetical protein